MAYMGGIIAASAAAKEEKRRQMLRAEEEEMTQYTQDDLKGDWEFKIVRADTAAFRKPGALDKLIEEEARAGWVMLEKLDDSRVRFKRPQSARGKDPFLPDDVDPYRTQYGTLVTRPALLVSVLLGLVMALGLGFFAFFRAEGQAPEAGSAVIVPLILVLIGVVAFLAVIAKRKLR